jgi:hypothetical protein
LHPLGVGAAESWASLLVKQFSGDFHLSVVVCSTKVYQFLQREEMGFNGIRAQAHGNGAAAETSIDREAFQ